VRRRADRDASPLHEGGAVRATQVFNDDAVAPIRVETGMQPGDGRMLDGDVATLVTSDYDGA
jgi:hypothetical protein